MWGSGHRQVVMSSPPWADLKRLMLISYIRLKLSANAERYVELHGLSYAALGRTHRGRLHCVIVKQKIARFRR
jgi:hypothetical protein